MTLVVKGIGWIALFVSVAIAPLVFAVIGVSGPGRGLATEFSVALGFVGLALMGLEFALVARFRAVAEPFGSDALVQFHREIGLVGLVFVLVHVRDLGALGPGDPAVRCRHSGTGSLGPAGDDRVAHAGWHIARAAQAPPVVRVLARAARRSRGHPDRCGADARPAGRLLPQCTLETGVVDCDERSICDRARLGTDREAPPAVGAPLDRRTGDRRRGQTTTLTLRADGHAGLDFVPGQYAWFAIGKSPFAMTKHPFSFSSSSEADGVVEVSIKALGDFTSTVPDIETGTHVYIDGPHGVFSPDLYEGPGFCLIAGGVGITPTMSILRTFADRGDQRPVVALIGSRSWDDITFREELDELATSPNLTLVHTLSDPPSEWAGETGRIDVGLLRRHLPTGYQRWQFFICGPDPMMDAMEDALLALDVSPSRIHTERFGWV